MRRILSFFLPPMKASLLLALACFLMSGALHADTANLLTNPGAETGDLSGWEVPAGSVSAAFFIDSIEEHEPLPHTGAFDFSSSEESDLLQRVSVFTQGITAAMINTGTLSAQISFWEQGANDSISPGSATILLLFSAANNITIGFDQTTTVDSHDGVWTEGGGTFLIPAGTTSITYFLQFNPSAPGLGPDEISIDDNSLTILTPVGTGTTPSPVPEPGTLALLGTGIAGLAGVARRKLAA